MPDTLVLCYHAISERWHADLAVTPSAFALQLHELRRHGYRGVTFSEAVDGPARHKRVAVTFDDAFSSVAAHARPVLDDLGWPGTVFAVTRFAADGAPLEWDGVAHWKQTEFAGELASLGWPQLRALADAGWEIGSHTVTHPRLTRASDAELADELERSRAEVEAGLGRPCPTLAYPYGDVDARVVEAAGRAGYAAAAALPSHWGAAKALEWPRVGVYHQDDLRRYRIKASRGVRRLRSTLKR